MGNIRWVIQNNLIAENDLKVIQNSCKNIGVEFEEVLVVPFSSELPKFTLDNKTNIYYGSTTFMNNIYNQLDKPIGLFYNHETFTMENYIEKWGEYMLNSESKIVTVFDILAIGYEDNETEYFVRPNGDGKEFDGQVMKLKDLSPFLERHLKYDSSITVNTKILVGPAYNIKKEWRNYIVDGKVVTSSLYRENFNLKKSNSDIPDSMLKFVEERLTEYQPHDNFAMDIAVTNDGTYYIIECGCLNSVGFYHADISKIVEKVSEKFGS
jgi:hypothetical protein